jgi:hypothetical protein
LAWNSGLKRDDDVPESVKSSKSLVNMVLKEDIRDIRDIRGHPYFGHLGATHILKFKPRSWADDGL